MTYSVLRLLGFEGFTGSWVQNKQITAKLHIFLRLPWTYSLRVTLQDLLTLKKFMQNQFLVYKAVVTRWWAASSNVLFLLIFFAASIVRSGAVLTGGSLRAGHRAPGKLTGCERDLAMTLPGCFLLLFVLPFIRKTKKTRLKNPTDLLHKKLKEERKRIIKKLFITWIWLHDLQIPSFTQCPYQWASQSSSDTYSETGCSFARHFAILSRNVGVLIGSLLPASCDSNFNLLPGRTVLSMTYYTHSLEYCELIAMASNITSNQRGKKVISLWPGYGNKEICSRLHLSHQTVSNILSKFLQNGTAAPGKPGWKECTVATPNVVEFVEYC